MPDPGVSLIPRGSKSTKKRRTSFRPASKKSNQNKSKATNASKATKAAVSKNAQESSVSTTDVAASALSSLVDSTLATAATTTATNTTNNSSTDVGASQPLSSPTKQSAPQPPLQKKSSRDDLIAEGEATPPKSTRSSSTTASSPTRTISPRKRKAHSLNKKISIGSSLRRRTEASVEADVSSSGKETADSSGIMNSGQEKPKDVGEGKENVAALDQQVKEHALTAASSHSIVPSFSAHDQAILNQLANEENEKEGKSLNSFCTPFKGPKRRLQKDKEGKKQNSNKDNENAKDSASKSASRVSSNAAADNKGQKVDATTNGAPSVQIIDGQIVLQESSVVLPSRRTVQEVEEEFRDNVVEEDEQLNIVQASYTSFVTKGDHGKTRKKGSWTIQETEKFYFALRQLGTDFGSMEALFFEDQRTRKQLKNKYRKELAKNPDLVQELALNPKYQTQLDMDSLNLEVDPKRIEAHENEEPPAYEPTDGDEIEEPVSTKKSDSNENGTDYNGVFEGEVVEEDAEEERLAEARAKQEQKKTASPSSAQHQDGEKEENPFSSEFREGAAADEEGPSMDDFFGDSYGDDTENADESSSAKKEESSAASSPAKKTVASGKETSEMVSLVPKKASSKTRRPKIRPSRRKK